MNNQQQIDPIQVSNNLMAIAGKNVSNLAGLLDQVIVEHQDKDQITRISNDLVANTTKQIASLSNIIESLVQQIIQMQHPQEEDKFKEYNAQQ